MSRFLFPFSLEGDRGHDLPVVQNLDLCLICIPPRYIYLILIEWHLWGVVWPHHGWMLGQFCDWLSCQTQSRSTQITVWFVSRKVRSLASAYTCLLHVHVSEGMGKNNILYTSLVILSPSNFCLVHNKFRRSFPRDSAIKLQKQSNPPSWATNWQQMSTNPVDYAHICSQGGLTHPLPPDDHW